MPGNDKPDPERKRRLDVGEVHAVLRTVVLRTGVGQSHLEGTPTKSVILSSSMACAATLCGMTPESVIARRPQADEAIPNCPVETASPTLAVTGSRSMVAEQPRQSSAQSPLILSF